MGVIPVQSDDHAVLFDPVPSRGDSSRIVPMIHERIRGSGCGNSSTLADSGSEWPVIKTGTNRASSNDVFLSL